MLKSSTTSKALVLKVGFVVAAIILVILGWYMWTSHASNNEQPNAQSDTSSRQVAGQYVSFSGTVTARNNGCAYDDVCTVSVDDKVIVTGSGLAADPNANIYGATDADLRIGDKVSVKARSTDNGLTLQGCQDCYITRGELRR